MKGEADCFVVLSSKPSVVVILRMAGHSNAGPELEGRVQKVEEGLLRAMAGQHAHSADVKSVSGFLLPSTELVVYVVALDQPRLV